MFEPRLVLLISTSMKLLGLKNVFSSRGCHWWPGQEGQLPVRCWDRLQSQSACQSLKRRKVKDLSSSWFFQFNVVNPTINHPLDPFGGWLESHVPWVSPWGVKLGISIAPCSPRRLSGAPKSAGPSGCFAARAWLGRGLGGLGGLGRQGPGIGWDWTHRKRRSF